MLGEQAPSVLADRDLSGLSLSPEVTAFRVGDTAPSSRLSSSLKPVTVPLPYESRNRK